uniref:Uncharacterized protein n=1 Tax=Oryza punctata TaxID=4537 RepID=A0A0E0JGP1_ORYPU
MEAWSWAAPQLRSVGASVGKILLPYAGDVALSVQVVSFACGGFTVVWGTNHVVIDGSALSMLVSAWSELARSGTLACGARPNQDRSVFRPRALPSYSASLDKAFTPLDGERQVNVPTSDESFVVHLGHRPGYTSRRAGTTRVKAVSAYLWKAFATVVGARDERCRLLRAAVRNYVGNVVTFTLAEVTVEEIQRKPLPEVASMARDVITTPAYDDVNWVEKHKAEQQRYVETATPTVTMSAFSSFPLDTGFGFGHAAMATPTAASAARLCSGFVQIAARTCGDGSWFASAFVWPRLAAALESDVQRVFRPVTADGVVSGGELHVRVVSRRLVKVSDESLHPHVLPVSNLDLLPQSMQVSMSCVYPKPSTGGFHDVVASFNAGLPDFLNHFFPFAGRLATNPVSGLPDIHCNNLGAELVVGEADVALSSLDYGTTAASLRKIQLPHARDVALSVQLVAFACGGFSVAWATDHVLVDGHALCMIVTAWSELARSGTLAPGSRPSHHRSVFRPRATPAYSAALDEAFTAAYGARLVNALTAEQSFVERLYYIEAADIARLREEASRDGGVRATRVQAVSAYLWKALAAVVGTADTHCRMGWWVDGRPRLTSPELRAAMRNYVGNVTTFACREASVEEVQRKPLPDVASMARDAVTAPAFDDEHFQELVDWVEEHKGGEKRYVKKAIMGLGSPMVGVTAFASFSLDTDFGFGDAAMAMPTTAAGSARLCSAFVQIVARPGGDGSWIASACIWPRLAAALETDERRIFKPVTPHDATMTMPLTMSGDARVSTGYVQFVTRPSNDEAWIVSAYLWPRLTAVLESNKRLERAFKPVTPEYLGLRPASVKQAGMLTSRI